MRKSFFILFLTSLMSVSLSSCGATKPSYTITWKDHDNSVLTTSVVDEGVIPTYPGSALSWDDDPAYEYTFSHWTPTPYAASRDVSYKAIYSQGEAKVYTITWLDGNGDTLKTEDLPYGETPSYSGTTPSKTSSPSTTYTFANSWLPEIVPVVSDATYTAVFREQYQITWLDGDGEILKIESYDKGQTPSYSGTTPSKTNTVSEFYTFNNTWVPAPSPLSGPVTYTAQFTTSIQQYTVTFMNEDGTSILGTSTVNYNTSASDSGIVTSKESILPYEYSFDGWVTSAGGSTSDDLSVVTANRTVYASYQKSLINTEGFTYTYQSATTSYELTKYDGTATKIVIPSTYDDGTNGEQKVTSVYKQAFNENATITEVYIMDNVTTLGDACFRMTSALTSIHLPETLTTMGSSCFYSCKALKNINFPSSLTSIGAACFFFAEKITSVSLSKNFASLGEQSFQNCASITAFTVEADNSLFSSVDGVLFNKNKSTLYYYPAAKDSSTYTIPSTVTYLSVACFSSSQYLTQITIPSTVTQIDGYTFYTSASLLKMVFQASIDHIPDFFLGNCSNLNTFTFDTTSAITTIESMAFLNCVEITSIFLPSSLETLSNGAFDGCTGLLSITLPTALCTIEGNAFYNCSALSTINIPKNVSSIDGSAFTNCNKIATITIESGNTSFSTQDNILYNADKTSLIFGAEASTLTSITLPGTLTSISMLGVFNWMNMETLFIPTSVTTLAGFGIYYCKKLTTIYCYASSQPTGWENNWQIANNAQIQVYWYSATEPASGATLSYWHMVESVPTLW